MDDPHERKADDLERDGSGLDDDIKNLREDWDSKKSSQQSPGAMDHADAMPGGLGDEEEDEGDDSDTDTPPDDQDERVEGAQERAEDEGEEGESGEGESEEGESDEDDGDEDDDSEQDDGSDDKSEQRQAIESVR